MQMRLIESLRDREVPRSRSILRKRVGNKEKVAFKPETQSPFRMTYLRSLSCWPCDLHSDPISHAKGSKKCRSLLRSRSRKSRREKKDERDECICVSQGTNRPTRKYFPQFSSFENAIFTSHKLQSIDLICLQFHDTVRHNITQKGQVSLSRC